MLSWNSMKNLLQEGLSSRRKSKSDRFILAILNDGMTCAIVSDRRRYESIGKDNSRHPVISQLSLILDFLDNISVLTSFYYAFQAKMF